ncbi:hypothetical protein MUP77_01665 [Candidatus Bathyarchaeota archaeon]|nr:hypothetical protein [Candidatus Bathyarchaeota archaeon]
MGFQTRIGTSRKMSQRPERTKTKTKGSKRRTSGRDILEEKPVPPIEKVAERTGNRLTNLGNQRFALPPFKAHFSVWLLNLKEILSEFEATPTLEIDDEYQRERSHILESIEGDLLERETREVPSKTSSQSLSESRSLLQQIEKEYVHKERNMNERKNSAITDLSNKIAQYEAELKRQTRLRIDFIGLFYRKAKIQREQEITQTIGMVQRDRILVEQRFAVEQEKLAAEYAQRKQQVNAQINECQHEIDAQDIDSSLETRRATCEALDRAVKILVQKSSSTRNL